MLTGHERRFEHTEDGLGDLDRILRPLRDRGDIFRARDLHQQEGEFITFKTRDGIAATNTTGQSFGDFMEQTISDGMTQRLVDGLEAIQVKEHHGEHLFASFSQS